MTNLALAEPTYAPKDPALLAHLLDQTLADLLVGPDRHDPTVALGAAGRAVAGTPWSGYRTGRARLSTLCATYLAWLAPPAGWSLTEIWALGRSAFVWSGPGGHALADVVTAAPPGAPVLDDELRPVVDAVVARGASLAGFAGVRLLALAGPRLSLLVDRSGVTPLVDTALWFEEA